MGNLRGMKSEEITEGMREMRAMQDKLDEMHNKIDSILRLIQKDEKEEGV